MRNVAATFGQRCYRGKVRAIWDVSVVFFHSPMDEVRWCDQPGLRVKGKLWVLNTAFYGAHTQFETVSIVPDTYHHPQGDTVVHGAVAEDGQLDHFEQVVGNSMEIERVGRTGPGRSSTVQTLRTASRQRCSRLKPTKIMQLRVVRIARYLKNNPRLIWAEEHRRVCGFGLCSLRDNVEVDVWGCGVLRQSADRVCFQYAERASTEHRRSRVRRNHGGLSAQLSQPGHSERTRVDGGSSCHVGRECWNKGRIAPRPVGRLKHFRSEVEKSLRLRKHPTETNTADLATKYLARPRKEMLLSAGLLVLSGEGEKTVRPS